MDEEEAEFVPVLAPHVDDSGTAADPAHSAVSTLHSTHSQEHQRLHHQLGAQLGRLKQETNRYIETHTEKINGGTFNCNRTQHKSLNICLCGVPYRLLEELLQKEKEYQQVLKATLQQRTHDLELVKVRHRPPGKHAHTGIGIYWMCMV